MYEEFYKLDKKPFRLNPDPSFYFSSTGHKRVLSYLRYGVLQAEGFIVVTGDVGTGKTTLIYTLLEQLNEEKDITIAHLASSQADEGDLLTMVVSAFGLEHEGLSQSIMTLQLKKFLMDQASAEKRTLLIVDESQGLSARGLEVLRMLTNFQMNGKALLQGFLVGQAEFRDMLKTPRMEQLRQRIITSCHLGPLKVDETRQYIEHRLEVAGWRNDPTFEDEVYEAIHAYTDGIPRRINKLCDRVLLVGYLEQTHNITQALFDSVVQELNDEAFEVRKEPRPGDSEEEGMQSNLYKQRLEELEERMDSVEKIIDAVAIIMTESAKHYE